MNAVSDMVPPSQHLDDSTFRISCLTASSSEAIAESTVSGAIVGSITSISVVVGASCDKRML